MPTLSKKKPELAIPKSDSKKEREALKRASKRLRDTNRDECLRLDDYKCRNPFCDCNRNPAIECAVVESHHILGRTKDNRYDGVEYRISLSRKCHSLYDKDRLGMIKILKQLRKTASDYRWYEPLKELERMV